jgi:3-hydroxybutyryl-CoA dehydrogenase
MGVPQGAVRTSLYLHANRLQHAVAREAFASIDQGLATPQVYPSLAVNTAGQHSAGKALLRHVSQGHLGMKPGQGFFTWTEGAIARERQRYDSLLQDGLKILSAELPPINNE